MILGQISYVDCVVFLICLIPQLLIQSNFFELLFCGLRAVPFICELCQLSIFYPPYAAKKKKRKKDSYPDPKIVIQIPCQFIRERYFTPESQRSPFVQQASPFQDFVIRCVRYAFAHIPANLGRVFFSRPVALPFLWFRMLRHGFRKPTIPWYEVTKVSMEANSIPSRPPSIMLFWLSGIYTDLIL